MEKIAKWCKGQLLDVVVVINRHEKHDDAEFPTSFVYRFDVEGKDIDKFLKACEKTSVEQERLVAER